MAYFGKEFKFEKEENFEAFINAIESAEEAAKSYLQFKPNHKVVKNGDEYTMSFFQGDFNKEVKFKPGVAFDETVGSSKSKTVFTVEGDTITQVQDFGPKGTITLKREYTPNSLKVIITSSKYDGSAVRYYVPA